MSKALVVVALLAAACGGPKVSRGGEGTGNVKVDQKALGVGLDKMDLDYLAGEYSNQLFASRFWIRDVDGASEQPRMAIWPIQNMTSQHLGDQLIQLLSSLETQLVNSGDVLMIARSRQNELMKELGVQHDGGYDGSAAQELGKQLGVKYFMTGKISSVEEKFDKTRRVQYTLFLQILELETGAIRFQAEASRSKAISR
jgi:hypothetical protein